MTPNKLRTSILAACAALTMTGIAYAGASADSRQDGPRQGHHMHRHGGHHGATPLMGTLRQLDLTDEQKQSIRSVFENTRSQRLALRDQQRTNRTALAATMPDDPKYPALIATQKTLAADAIQHSSDRQTQIYALLTPEQKAQIPQLLAERKARQHERRERMKERGARRKAEAVS